MSGLDRRPLASPGRVRSLAARPCAAHACRPDSRPRESRPCELRARRRVLHYVPGFQTYRNPEPLVWTRPPCGGHTSVIHTCATSRRSAVTPRRRTALWIIPDREISSRLVPSIARIPAPAPPARTCSPPPPRRVAIIVSINGLPSDGCLIVGQPIIGVSFFGQVSLFRRIGSGSEIWVRMFLYREIGSSCSYRSEEALEYRMLNYGHVSSAVRRYRY